MACNRFNDDVSVFDLGTRKQVRRIAADLCARLGVLLDLKTVLETIPGVEERSRKTLGLRASGTVNPPMDLYFDSETFRLVRLDWREDVYRYSDWHEVDGMGYHKRTAMFKKGAAEPWFHHEVVSIEPLPALPEGLSR